MGCGVVERHLEMGQPTKNKTKKHFNLQTMLASQTTSMVETDQKFEISLVMPEDTLLLSASTAENKMEWFVNLQKYILLVLGIF